MKAAVWSFIARIGCECCLIQANMRFKALLIQSAVVNWYNYCFHLSSLALHGYVKVDGRVWRLLSTPTVCLMTGLWKVLIRSDHYHVGRYSDCCDLPRLSSRSNGSNHRVWKNGYLIAFPHAWGTRNTHTQFLAVYQLQHFLERSQA